jgi:hypothetical protein
MNNETYQAAELKNDGLSPPLMAPFLTKPSKKKNGGLFKRSGKLDLQKTTFNARKDVVFIKHKPISELTLPDPNLKLSQQIVGFAPTKSHDHLLKRQESSSSISLSPNNHNVNTLASKKHEPKTTSINMIASKPLSERKVESKSTSKVELKEQSVKNIERHDIKGFLYFKSDS